MSQQDNKEMAKHFYRASADRFKMPGSPLAYWASNQTIEAFNSESVRSVGEIRQGLLTSDNERFLRRWHELALDRIGFGLTREEAKESGLKWFPINKGGGIEDGMAIWNMLFFGPMTVRNFITLLSINIHI
ncbi:hypothetical protein H2136_22635 [Aeromonas hydrophila]|uniref:Uncharacterized protein n=1 Tax=Aeromonas hydrophila TaxID=644 RepID=A0A926IZ81_AERHY|nr:hypothetical protein [Aeromonas hydrophila]